MTVESYLGGEKNHRCSEDIMKSNEELEYNTTG